MAFLEAILNFITDKTRRISARATVIIISFLLILLVDNIIGFSYYYNKERQISQLRDITQLLKDPSVNLGIKKELIILQNESLNRKNWIEKSIDFVENISFESSIMTTKNHYTTSRNNFWFLISSSGLYILVLLLLPIILLLDRSMPFFQLLITIIVFALVMVFTAWFNYWLFDKILPNEIFGNWIWNYILNVILQTGLAFGLYWATNNINKINGKVFK